MGKAEADWKHQRRHPLDWFTVGVGALLSAVYVGLWWLDGQPAYLAVAVGLLAWLVGFFTRFWQPILYLFVAVVVASLTALFVGRGVWRRPVFLPAIALNVVYLLLVVFLFASEERAT